jgi:hypothetical protein
VASTVAVVVAFGPSARADGAAPSPSSATDDADALYRQGREAFQRGDIEAAYRAFVEAYARKPSAEIAGNLGVVELKLGRSRDAAEHLANALREFPIGANPAAKKQLEGQLEEAKRGVATVKLEVTPPGARLEVDGRALGTAPLDVDVYVEPGTRRFSASLAEHAPSEVVLPLDAGARRVVTIALARSRASTADASAPQPTDEGAPLWPIVTSSAVAAVGLGLGIGFLANALAIEDELAGATCPSPAACEAAFGADVDALNTSRVVAGTGFGLAAVGLAGLVVSIAVGMDEEPPASVSVAPWFSPSSAGVGALLRY